MILHMTECTERERELFGRAVAEMIDRRAGQARELRDRAMGPGISDADADSMNRTAVRYLNELDELEKCALLVPGLRKCVTLAKHGRFPPRGEID